MRQGIWSPGVLISGGLLCACVLLGGATRSGFVGDILLQVLAVPILLVGFDRHLRAIDAARRPGAGGRAAIWLACLALAIPLIQLVPLPPSIWMRLPGHGLVAEVQGAIGGGPGWRPVTVSPEATWLGALSLLPPFALFLMTVQLSFRERARLVLVLLAAVLVSAVLGLLQVAQGPESPLRFFEFTNRTEAVGFFANRNHFAALLYTGLLLAMPWTVAAARELAVSVEGRRAKAPVILPALAIFIVLVLLISAQLMTRSRAGLAMTIAAVLGGGLLSASDPRGQMLSARRVLAAGFTVAVMFSAQFALYRVMERLGADPLKDARIPFARNTVEAALAFMPFGSGAGTFVPVYATYEKPADTMVAYANRAHNDYLELWLETGMLGMVLALAFLVWLAMRGLAAWRAFPDRSEPIDRLLARAAAMGILLLLAHSAFDYPLRTGAMLAVFALSCALLVEPPRIAIGDQGAGIGHREREAERRPSRSRRLRDAEIAHARASAHPTDAADTGLLSRPRGMQRWTTDQAWPEAWQPPGEGEKSPRGKSKPDKP